MISKNSNDKVIGKVLTYNPGKNTNSFLGYTEKSIHTKHGKMYKVTTAIGHTIKVTDDHSLATTGVDNFFAPVPPQESMGKFVPIVAEIDYPIPEEVMNEATVDVLTSLSTLGRFSIDETLLNAPPVMVSIVLDSVLKGDNTKDLTYTCFDADQLELVKILCARVGFLVTSIKDNTLTVSMFADKLIPEDGKLLPYSEVIDSNPANPYLKLPFTWDEVVKVEEIEREEVTYDFSVPEFPLFIANGILVYDTMQLHVPATESARVEALEKMLPSKNLFSPMTMSPMMLPQQEHIFGLFAASKNIDKFNKNTKFIQVADINKLLDDINMGTIKPDTPVIVNGRKTVAALAAVNDVVPMQFRVYDKTWNKKTVTQILSQIGRTIPDKYALAADTIKEIGSLCAYKLGVSYKASDFNIKGIKAKRDAFFKKVEKAMDEVEANKNLSKDQKEKMKVNLLLKAQEAAQKITDAADSNNFHSWAYSGSKGKKSQIMQIITSPTVVADPKDRLIPMLIHKSYLEGLSPSDYWVSSYGTRKGTVGAKLSVAPAGGLAKELVGNVLDVVVSEKNCGTRRGLTRNISDTDNIINRVEATTGNFIDGNYIEQLKKRGVTTVVVRSPATCECRHGVCQYCYGYNEKLKFPDIGENVGVVSTHSITEPLTQLGLSSKHSAGTAGGGLMGFGAIKAFYNMSTKFSGAAVITEVTGVISKIEPAPAGGTNVYVGKKKYFVPPMRNLKVKVGDSVRAGDALTDGILNMAKIVPHKGIDQGRKLFIESANDLYQKSEVGALKKNFEVLARGLINYVQIDDPGDFDEYIIGDIVDYNELMADIRKSPGKRPPTFTPVQKGTNKAPTDKKDWLANFGFKYLKGELINNAATNAKSPLHSYHPIGGYARGSQFGKGTDGKY